MSGPALLRHQLGYELRVFLRNPASVFFTAVLPLIFLFVFVTIFGNEPVDQRGDIKQSTFYVAGILALAVISATFVNLAISLTALRENGVLKRLRGTPVPNWVFIGARVGTALVISVGLVVLLAGLGRLVYGVELPTNTLPGMLVALLVGAAAFCCLGIAYTALIPSENAAPPITNALVLPLYFISGTFFSVDRAPEWLRRVAGVFPVRHFNDALFTAFDPATEGAGFSGRSLLVISAWGVVGLLAALRLFRWTPRGTGS